MDRKGKCFRLEDKQDFSEGAGTEQDVARLLRAREGGFHDGDASGSCGDARVDAGCRQGWREEGREGKAPVERRRETDELAKSRRRRNGGALTRRGTIDPSCVDGIRQRWRGGHLEGGKFEFDPLKLSETYAPLVPFSREVVICHG